MATTSINKSGRNIIFESTFPAHSFEKEANSPFEDGYSISKEESYLASYIASGADENSPLHERYVELQDRRERFSQMQRERNQRNGADAIVSNEEARTIDDLGGLVDDGVDQMTIHTLEAHRMFMGRSREPGGQSAPIIGGKRVAAALRNLWLLTVNDNPYADWALVRHEHAVNQVLDHLRAEISKAEALRQSQKQRGLSFLSLPLQAQLP